MAPIDELVRLASVNLFWSDLLREKELWSLRYEFLELGGGPFSASTLSEIRQVDSLLTRMHTQFGCPDWLARFRSSGGALPSPLARYPPRLRLLAPELGGTIVRLDGSDAPLPLVAVEPCLHNLGLVPLDLFPDWVSHGCLASDYATAEQAEDLFLTELGFDVQGLHFSGLGDETLSTDIIPVLQHTLRALQLPSSDASQLRPPHLTANSLWQRFDDLGEWELTSEQCISPFRQIDRMPLITLDLNHQTMRRIREPNYSWFKFASMGNLSAEQRARMREHLRAARAKREGKRKMTARIEQNRREAEERKREPCSICMETPLVEARAQGAWSSSPEHARRLADREPSNLPLLQVCLASWSVASTGSASSAS